VVHEGGVGWEGLMVMMVEYHHGIEYCQFGGVLGLLQWFLQCFEYQKLSETESKGSTGSSLEIFSPACCKQLPEQLPV